MPSDTTLLAIVAIINAIGSAIALVITAVGAAQRPRSETHDVGDVSGRRRETTTRTEAS